jgi:hypothetical protein
MNCDASSLIQEAKCYRCIPTGMQAATQTYTLAEIAGESSEAASLIESAQNFLKVPAGEQMRLQIYLLCQILDSMD